MKLETSDCWQNEENFKALLMVTKIFNLSLWKVEKMSNENRAIFMRRVVVCTVVCSEMRHAVELAMAKADYIG